MDGNKFGKNLRQLRIQKNMNQKQVALELNITPQTYSNYERGNRFPGPDMLCRLAAYYQISLDQLLSTDLCPQNTDPFAKLPPEYQALVRSYHELTTDDQKLVMDYITFLKQRP